MFELQVCARPLNNLRALVWKEERLSEGVVPDGREYTRIGEKGALRARTIPKTVEQ